MSSSIGATSVATAAATIATPLASQCFVRLNDTITPATGWGACGNTNATAPFVSCCENNDYCLEDGLCRYKQSKVGGSGYYVAGCTDQQYADGSCPQLCNSLPVKDAVFVTQPSRLWKCCGAMPDGTPNCDAPTDENFDASRPERLDTYWQVGVGSIAPTATKSNSASDTSTPSAPTGPVTVTAGPSSPASGGNMVASTSSISPGLAGGIAAGAAAGVFLLSLIIIMIYKRKRPKRVREIPGGYDARRGPMNASTARRVASFDSTDRSESPFVHAISAPWPLGNVEKRDAPVVGKAHAQLPVETAWEMPADSARSKTPQPSAPQP